MKILGRKVELVEFGHDHGKTRIFKLQTEYGITLKEGDQMRTMQLCPLL